MAATWNGKIFEHLVGYLRFYNRNIHNSGKFVLNYTNAIIYRVISSID